MRCRSPAQPLKNKWSLHPKHFLVNLFYMHPTRALLFSATWHESACATGFVGISREPGVCLHGWKNALFSQTGKNESSFKLGSRVNHSGAEQNKSGMENDGSFRKKKTTYGSIKMADKVCKNVISGPVILASNLQMWSLIFSFVQWSFIEWQQNK